MRVDMSNVNTGKLLFKLMIPILAAAFMNVQMLLAKSPEFAGGDGSKDAPWQVTNLDHLQMVGEYLDAHFIQMDDIDASGVENFLPIAMDSSFSGSYHGNDFVISNLTINRSEDSDINIGLFSELAPGAVLESITIENADVTGYRFVGILAGRNAGGVILNSYTSGVVSALVNNANTYAGGVTGFLLDGGIIENSGSSADVFSAFNYAGGLVGLARDPETIVSDSWASGSVSADRVAGGLVGQVQDQARVERSWASGDVLVTSWTVGGLVGTCDHGCEILESHAAGSVVIDAGSGNSRWAGGLAGLLQDNGDLGSRIVDSYSTASVTGATHSGGLIGRMRNGSPQLLTSFAAGAVTGDHISVGGFIGTYDVGPLADNYWDIESTGKTAPGAGTQEGVTGLTTVQMTGTNASDNMIGFDFDNIWILTENYPALYWEDVETEEPPLFAGGDGSEEDPWQVENLDHLMQVGSYLNDHFIQISDINAAAEENFMPIAFDSVFSGRYDGNGHTISNLTINRISETDANIGLFSVLGAESVVKNLTLEDADVTGFRFVGIVAGRITGGNVSNVQLSGNISATDGDANTYAGAVTGYLTDGGSILDAGSTANVYGAFSRAGGIVGVMAGEGTLMYNSWSSGDVTTDRSAGGLASIVMEGAKIERSWASGNIFVETWDVGGLVGHCHSGCEIHDSFASGSAIIGEQSTNSRWAGGIAGRLEDNSSIINSYSTASVKGATHTGGLIGRMRNASPVVTSSFSAGTVTGDHGTVGGFIGTFNDGVLTNNYWDVEATGKIEPGTGAQGTVTGLTTSQMTGANALNHMTGLDFENTWQLNISYPALFWEDVETVEPPLFAGGDGSEEDPWQVENLDQLLRVAEYLDDHFIQIADIDAGSDDNFTPIGLDSAFSGSFDGNDFVISNLTINRMDSTVNIGMFSELAKGGALKNITIENASVTGYRFVGILAGRNMGGEIANCHTSGEVTGWSEPTINTYTGGITGYMAEGGSIRHSGSSANVISGFRFAGGLAGMIEGDGTFISDSWATGDVTADRESGGLVGQIQDKAIVERSWSSGNIFVYTWGVGGITGYCLDGCQIIESYATGSVTIDANSSNIRWAGGLTGRFEDQGNLGSRIVDSYSTASITAHDVAHTGGLIGRMRNGFPEVIRSYSAGLVDGEGGFIGTFNDGSITHSYWDMEATGKMEPGSGAQSNVTGLSTEQMSGTNAIDNMGGFDFANIWVVTEGYPALHWEDVEPIELPETVELIRPENESTGVTVPVTFEWQEAEDVDSYNVRFHVVRSDPFSGEKTLEFFMDTTGIASTELVLDEEAGFEPLTTYSWSVQSVRGAISSAWSEAWEFETADVTSSENLSDIPKSFELRQNYPNPFNPVTQIQYALPEAIEVTLEVYDVLGRRLSVLVNEQQQAGWHEISFDASRYSSGIYIYRISAGDFRQTRQMMLIK
jgi:hypothetical protein